MFNYFVSLIKSSYFFVCLFVCLFVRLFVCLSVCLLFVCSFAAKCAPNFVRLTGEDKRSHKVGTFRFEKKTRYETCMPRSGREAATGRPRAAVILCVIRFSFVLVSFGCPLLPSLRHPVWRRGPGTMSFKPPFGFSVQLLIILYVPNGV